nr:NADH-quinone oxidoreductase subunit NuoF [Lagierella sp.]
MDLKELISIKDRTLPQMALRSNLFEEVDSIYEKQVLICGDTGCRSSHSDIIEEEIRQTIKEAGKEKSIDVVRVGCFGLCEAGPIAIVYPGGKFYAYLKEGDGIRIAKEDLIGNDTIEELLYQETLTDDVLKSIYETTFYKKQKKIAHKNCGLVNPNSIEEYIALDGYRGLEKALTKMNPQEVIDVIKESGLRGRGGGGFPTGMKWQFTKDATGSPKYVICNADEGDPGAFMDRSILEGDPYAVIEAMTIAAYAIGASQGYIYIRAEYPSAVALLERSIAKAKELNLLGNNIMGSGFSFDLELRLGAGAFVCGEEMALIESIEGKRGIPRNKPPFPANEGLWGKPTLINNVETYANVAQIIFRGASWFNSIGTEKSKGTKVFTLGGNIKRTGIIEVPMGTTLREIIYDIGGGIIDDKEFKAVQTGGPSGGCITKDYLDTPIDYDNLTALGSMMGSGGMIVMDEDTCMVDIARFFLEFTVDESCGKCTPCREGTKRMLEILERITEGNGTMEDIDTLEELGNTIKISSLCGLGQSAPNPVLSTLRYFRDEYEAHVKEKRCPAHHCKNLLSYFISDTCIGCTRCKRECPVNCIEGEVKKLHVINQDACIKCGNCMEVCPTNSVVFK